MMKCYIDHNKNEKAILIYNKWNGFKNDISNILFIKSCSNIGAYNKCKPLIDYNKATMVIFIMNQSKSVKSWQYDIIFRWKSGHNERKQRWK